ncbi:MAG: hypothetical protein JRH20_30325 [Deltaproteobacteria bacterium]|nr:hypothetical protein [Deltaproteobacteria bacterium]
MYLRVTTVRRGPKTYHYAQIVESYRREDGTPTNRIIASLGSRSDAEIAAIRAALKIARTGTTPVLPAQALAHVQVMQSLRYLDVAVLLQTWRDFGLHDLVADALGPDRSTVSTTDIVTALVLQRCLAPASKLAASRWYPTTALPELLGVDSKRFNNSRVHRALTSLEAADARLQEQIPEHLIRTQGASSVLFLDATDTWFVGQGPPLAAKGRDKQGLYRRRVGIVLLCDGQGLPLRWHTLDGRYHDPTALGDMAAEVAEFPWATQVPMVIDRALGNSNWVEKLDTLGLRYVTCVPAPELESCGAPIPWKILEDLQQCGEDLSSVEAKAAAAGFIADGGERHVLELGLFDKSRPQNIKRISQAQLTLQTLEKIEGSDEAIAALASRLEISSRSVNLYKKLTTLGDRVRQRIRRGDADGLSVGQLQQIAAVAVAQQLEQLEAEIAATSRKYLQARQRRLDAPATLQSRAALSLNPSRLIEDRSTDEKRLERVRQCIEDVNRRLASPLSQRKDSAALAEVDGRIRRLSLGNVCSTSMHKTDASRRVVLQVDDDAWRRRRRSDGISLVISHPEVEGTAAQRVKRYFSKDAIEKDFQSIKSVLGLRPVRHRTDHKLRAHVCVCVLALLLTRLLEQRFAHKGDKHTLSEITEHFEPARLNLIDDGNSHYYALAKPTAEAEKLLATIGATHLADNAAISKVVVPR